MAVPRAIAVAALVLAAVALLSPVCDARFILVGNSTDPIEPWTQIGVNYTQWAIDNPFYVGDVAVFKYRASFHVVWQLPDQNSYENCVYDNALFIGNASAGVGPGFFVNVTADPLYLACGIFGHCEVGQKVVIQATLGPLPATLNGVDIPPPPPFTPPAVATNPPPALILVQAPPLTPPVAASPPPPPSTSPTTVAPAPQTTSSTHVGAAPKAAAPAGAAPAGAGAGTGAAAGAPKSSTPVAAAGSGTPAPSPSAASVVGPAVASLVMIASAIVLLL